MPELSFAIESVQPMNFSATPMLVFRLKVVNAGEEDIHSVALNSQLQIEPARRSYSPAQKNSLSDLFGEPERWGSTVRPLFWTSLSTTVPAFRGATSFDLRVPCTFDFNVAATKYFHAVEDAEIPVALLFSGTVFYIANQEIQIAPIPWSSQTSCRIPAQAWREMMRLHYPHTTWLSLRQDVFDRLYRYKVRNGLPTWEQMVEHILAAAGELD
jgi:Family of unknown function (DUF6084)